MNMERFRSKIGCQSKEGINKSDCLARSILPLEIQAQILLKWLLLKEGRGNRLYRCI